MFVNPVSTEWIVVVCSINWLCGYYKNGVYMQLIRSTIRRCLRGRQHGPAGKCICPKNKPA